MANKKNIIKIRPIMAVVCDDIRQESNNKQIIVGTYGGGIILQLPKESGVSLDQESDDLNKPVSIPKPLFLSLWVPFEVSSAGLVLAEFKLLGPDPKAEISIRAQVEYSEAPKSYEMPAFSFTGLPLKAKESGELKIVFKHEDEDEWIILRTIPVTVLNSELPKEPLLP
ncbi:MAG: hypothetical protein KJ017_11420 [Alphaproteobacteria bacterium]|nr:hypothetical protein [Alphaproteobacteria bacterium]